MGSTRKPAQTVCRKLFQSCFRQAGYSFSSDLQSDFLHGVRAVGFPERDIAVGGARSRIFATGSPPRDFCREILARLLPSRFCRSVFADNIFISIFLRRFVSNICEAGRSLDVFSASLLREIESQCGAFDASFNASSSELRSFSRWWKAMWVNHVVSRKTMWSTRGRCGMSRKQCHLPREHVSAKKQCRLPRRHCGLPCGLPRKPCGLQESDVGRRRTSCAINRWRRKWRPAKTTGWIVKTSCQEICVGCRCGVPRK